MANLLCCAQCCTIFSLSGLIFLLIIGSLLHTQPLYIRGPQDPAKASQACYSGALIYFGTFAISFAYWLFNGLYVKLHAMITGTKPKNAPSEETIKFGNKYGAVSEN